MCSGPVPRFLGSVCWPGRSGLDRHDVDRLAATFRAELNRACGESEQGVVTAAADVHTGVELGSTLTDEDLARLHGLTAEPLHAEVLRVGVTAVARVGRALLGCHGWSGSLLVDAGDLEAGQPLPVTLTLVVAGLALELVDTDLRALDLLDDLARDRDLRQRVSVRRDLAVVDHHHGGKGVLGARLAVELLDLDDIADGDLVLLAAGLDDCIRRHGSLLITRLLGWGYDDPPDRGPSYRVLQSASGSTHRGRFTHPRASSPLTLVSRRPGRARAAPPAAPPLDGDASPYAQRARTRPPPPSSSGAAPAARPPYSRADPQRTPRPTWRSWPPRTEWKRPLPPVAPGPRRCAARPPQRTRRAGPPRSSACPHPTDRH